MASAQHYTRLSFEEREEISRGLVGGKSFRAIARQLKRAPSTVANEVAHCPKSTPDYRAVGAQRKAQRQAASRNFGKRKIMKDPTLEGVVCRGLLTGWSPDQVVKRLHLAYPLETGMHVSPETIYAYIYVLPRGTLRKELIAGLRREHKYRYTTRKRGEPKPEKRGRIADMLSIEERPAEVADRIVPGHWEGDLIIGKYKQSAIGTLVERTTRFTLIVSLPAKDAATVRKCFAKAVKRIPDDLRRTLTYDQGTEMAQHKKFSKQTKMQVYFAHPGSPWERGTNENTNGLIRQYFPKGTDFRTVTPKQIRHVQDLLNGRPRRTLGYYTPEEKFNECVALKAGD